MDTEKMMKASVGVDLEGMETDAEAGRESADFRTGESQRTVPVGGIQKFSTEDGPGIRTTVFLKGCPLNCKWCHNPELIEFGQQLIRLPNKCIGCGYCMEVCPEKAVFKDSEGKIDIDRSKCSLCMKCVSECFADALKPVAKDMTASQIMEEVVQDKGFYKETGGGMTISGGEMLAHPETAAQLIEMAAAEGIQVCVDTSGFGDGKVLAELACRENVSHVLFDMKAVDSAIHEQYTGQANQLILDNLRMLAAKAGEKIIMRMPLIAEVNDTPEMISHTGELYRECGLKKVTLLPYHDLGITKEKNIGGVQEKFQPPSEERIQEIFDYFQNEIGMEVEILGKV